VSIEEEQSASEKFNMLLGMMGMGAGAIETSVDPIIQTYAINTTE
jgi:hypothetical protein